MSKKINVGGIEAESFVDGDGIRMAVFVQGCSIHCPYCHNQSIWDHSKGTPMDIDTILKIYKQNSLLDGITITGGEPTEQAEACYELAKRIHQEGGNVWCYTGHTVEEILTGNNEFAKLLLEESDVIVDGPYIDELRDLDLAFRGSSNQRIIRKGDYNAIIHRLY